MKPLNGYSKLPILVHELRRYFNVISWRPFCLFVNEWWNASQRCEHTVYQKCGFYKEAMNLPRKCCHAVNYYWALSWLKHHLYSRKHDCMKTPRPLLFSIHTPMDTAHCSPSTPNIPFSPMGRVLCLCVLTCSVLVCVSVYCAGVCVLDCSVLLFMCVC